MSALIMTGRTDPGMVREHNEDCFLIVPESGFALLADGMGGHLAGEVASAMAVDQINQHLLTAFRDPPRESNGSFESGTLVDAIKLANAAIHEASMTSREKAGMGTTIVAVAFHGNRLTVAHVGDSRLYRFRQGKLQQITEDHSMVQELLRRGLISPEEARTSANKNLVTRALGVDPIVDVDVKDDRIETGDIYLLCSDGLNDVLMDDEIATILAEHGQDLEVSTQHMVEEVNRRGGPDNVSVVLIRTDGAFDRSKGN